MTATAEKRIDWREYIGKVYVGDCLEWLSTFSPNCVDLSFVDPPYNRGKQYGDFGDNLPWGEYDDRARELVDQLTRISRRGIAVFVPATLSQRWWQWMPEAEQVAIEKGAIGNVSSSGWVQQYFVLLTTARPLKRESAKNLWKGIRLPGEGYYFHEERPDHPGLTAQALVARVLQTLTLPGEIVLDPMIGSGTTAVVAERLDRQWIGCELNPEYAEMAEKRIQRERDKLQFDFGGQA